MSKGEVCLLTIKSDYGYGNTGVGPIPPKATLIFEIELLDWNEKAAGYDYDKLLNTLIVVIGLIVILLWAYIHFVHRA